MWLAPGPATGFEKKRHTLYDLMARPVSMHQGR